MTEQRGNWTSSAGFILAATGSAIGLGNLWKFPFITWENNGGAFVLVYLVCIAAVGLPIMMAELLIGRKTQKSAVGALKEAVGPAWGLVGLWGVLCGFTLLSYYTVIAGWSLYFFAKTAGWMVGGFPAGTSLGQVFTEQSANGGLQIALSLGVQRGNRVGRVLRRSEGNREDRATVSARALPYLGPAIHSFLRDGRLPRSDHVHLPA